MATNHTRIRLRKPPSTAMTTLYGSEKPVCRTSVGKIDEIIPGAAAGIPAAAIAAGSGIQIASAESGGSVGSTSSSRTAVTAVAREAQRSIRLQPYRSARYPHAGMAAIAAAIATRLASSAEVEERPREVCR